MSNFIIGNRGQQSELIDPQWEYHYYHLKNDSTYAPIKLHLNVANNPNAIEYIRKVLNGNEGLIYELKFAQKKFYENLPKHIKQVTEYQKHLDSKKSELTKKEEEWIQKAPLILDDEKRLLDYAQTTIYFKEDHINKISTGDEEMLEFLMQLNALANDFLGPATNEWRYQKVPALDKIIFTIGNNDLGKYVSNELATDLDTKKLCEKNISLLDNIIKSLTKNIKHRSTSHPHTTGTLQQQQHTHHPSPITHHPSPIINPNDNLNKPLLRAATRQSNSTTLYNAFTGALSGGIIAAAVTGIMIAAAATTLPWLGPAIAIGAAIGLSMAIYDSCKRCYDHNTQGLE